MKPHYILFIPTVIAACAITGCNHDSARSEYPDRSQETKAQADALHQEGARRDQVIENDLQQKKVALSFEQGQVENKAKQEREQISIERDQKIQPLKARQDEARASCKRECERIDQDTVGKIASVSGDEALRVKANAESKTAEVKRKMAEEVADAETNITKANQAADKRLANVDEGEAKQKSDIGLRRSEADRKAREDHLKVAGETTGNLDKVGKQSAERKEKQRVKSADIERKDQEISTAVRKDLARRGDPTKGVTVATDDGVVMLTGAVSDEAMRREIVLDTGKISGVVRVDDRLAVR